MRLAFCLFNYFPFGGLQQDFLRIALECRERGHAIRVFTRTWEGERPEGIEVVTWSVPGRTNHARCAAFADRVEEMLVGREVDRVVGFNKMPGLDLYFAGDTCFEARARNRSPLYRLGARYRTFARLERAVFAPGKPTRILILSDGERRRYIRCHGTEPERFVLLPPGIAEDRLIPLEQARPMRDRLRRKLALGEDEFLLLLVGSGFRTKGVDRALRALAKLPAGLRDRCRLLVVGRGNDGFYRRMARLLGVAERVNFLGLRRDVPDLLCAADLLIHPARQEAAGKVLLEAMGAGLPVLATEVCGYAFHVTRARGGEIAPEPFDLEGFAGLLSRMLDADRLSLHGARARAYAESIDLTGLAGAAADAIEDHER